MIKMRDTLVTEEAPTIDDLFAGVGFIRQNHSILGTIARFVCRAARRRHRAAADLRP